MSKKKQKNRKQKNKNNFKTSTVFYVSSKDIDNIAFKVFGSKYYTPEL